MKYAVVDTGRDALLIRSAAGGRSWVGVARSRGTFGLQQVADALNGARVLHVEDVRRALDEGGADGVRELINGFDG